MNIAIVGIGNFGSALAQGLAGKGHRLVLGVRDIQAADAIALAARTGARLAVPAEAAKDAEIVILALPWAVAEEAVRALGPLAGKVVIDCMNPLGMVDGALGLTIGHSTSGGERVAAWLPLAYVRA